MCVNVRVYVRVCVSEYWMLLYPYACVHVYMYLCISISLNVYVYLRMCVHETHSAGRSDSIPPFCENQFANCIVLAFLCILQIPNLQRSLPNPLARISP